MSTDKQQQKDQERARIRELVIEGRRRQGLPDHIEDPATLARIAALLLEGEHHDK